MEQFLRYYLTVFIISFVVLVFVVPSVRVYRQTGINPFRFATKHDEAHDFIGNTMKVFIVLILITVLIFSFFPKLYSYLAPFVYLDLKFLKVIGMAMGHISLAFIIVAQNQMKQSWRIGIDYENKTRLITHGLFSISRNPIYLFLLIALTGLFIIIPNAITLAVLFAAYLILNITMRVEETFLITQHGQEYIEYKRLVRRLI